MNSVVVGMVLNCSTYTLVATVVSTAFENDARYKVSSPEQFLGGETRGRGGRLPSI
jgi:hypothetical protein